MFKKILIVVAILIAGFAIVVALQPADFRVERSAVITASPATIFSKVNDLRVWNEFSPWAKLDPAARNTFSGPATGEGATFAWAGNNEVGEGSMTIITSRPHDLIRMRLDFVKPFEGTSTTEFTFTPQGNQTAVTWSMSGKNNFFFKAVGLFMNCDKMMGPQFEQGLANLKALSEKQP